MVKHRRHFILTAITLVGALAFAPRVEAQAPTERRIDVSVHLGLTTPTGVFGARVGYFTLAWLRAEGGLGLSVNQNGNAIPVFMAGVSVVPFRGVFRPYVAVSLSTGGSYGALGEDQAVAVMSRWDRPVNFWANGEVGLELAISHHAYLAIEGGGGRILGERTKRGDSDRPYVANFGFAFGHLF